MNRRRNKRRAFVTALAVMLMALVAVALLALTNQVATSARQANSAREGAQAEQLLLAGLEIARQTKPTGSQSIKLPTTLADESASLTITRQGNQATVEARVGNTTLLEPPQR